MITMITAKLIQVDLMIYNDYSKINSTFDSQNQFCRARVIEETMLMA